MDEPSMEAAAEEDHGECRRHLPNFAASVMRY
jgi:hypothetical protein